METMRYHAPGFQVHVETVDISVISTATSCCCKLSPRYNDSRAGCDSEHSVRDSQ